MTRSPIKHFVFAYGSLLRDPEQPPVAALRPARLREHRRLWNVAMDNTLSLPGYKCYLDPRDGSRPAVFVSFLDILAAPGQSLNGALLPIREEQLPAFDRRERNYQRRDVSQLLAEPIDGRVWAYFGRPDAQQRFSEGLREGRAVVHRDYLDLVRDGFALLTPDALAEFDASTEPPACPVRELQRVELR